MSCIVVKLKVHIYFPEMTDPKIPKFTFLKIILPTANVNHTALFKYIESHNTRGQINLDTFRRMFYGKARYTTHYRKDTQSREHDDEVIT